MFHGELSAECQEGEGSGRVCGGWGKGMNREGRLRKDRVRRNGIGGGG